MDGGHGHSGYQSLADTAVGQRVRVAQVWADRALTRRLCDLGLPVGAVVAVIHRQGDGGLVVEHHDARLALGGDMSRRIGVVAADGPQAADIETEPADNGEA